MYFILFLLFSLSSQVSPGLANFDLGEELVGEKLLLTPYIKSGRIEEARKLAEVPPLIGTVKSYSGFITVDEACESNMFFWFFPAAQDADNVPLSVWLQGGPGSSSLFGLFTENGPYELTPRNKLRLREYSWHKASSMIFIENPVGTGFSYTSSLNCYSQNQTHVGQNLLSLIRQFMVLFPEMKSKPFFVTGESYAGKYVPAFSYAIHKHNEVARDKINLQGLAIGNGLVDPLNQLDYGEYLYQLGLIDTAGLMVMSQKENECKDYTSAERWTEAFFCFDTLMNGDSVDGKTVFHNLTGFNGYYNYLGTEEAASGDLDEFFKKSLVRRAIHVGNAEYSNHTLVLDQIKQDWMKSVAPWLEELLEHYRVLLYNGQLDIILAYPLTEAYIKKLQWSGAEEYQSAERHQWRVDSELAGYSKTVGHLTEVLVRDAGHMVPTDQPKWAFDLFSRFIHNKPFF